MRYLKVWFVYFILVGTGAMFSPYAAWFLAGCCLTFEAGVYGLKRAKERKDGDA